MRRLGLIGGMSWTSTAVYYRAINEGVQARLGGLHSADLLLHSVDFASIARMQQAGEWQAAADQLAGSARKLASAGAQALVLCTNTMHKVADQLQAAVDVPLLHIVDPTGDALRAAGIERVALLGTRFTMEEPFYRDRLQARFAIEAIQPEVTAREDMHRIIYEELCRNIISDVSRQRVRNIVADLKRAGAQAVILGCTEIGLLVGADDLCLPTFDTTALHAAAAVDFAVADA